MLERVASMAATEVLAEIRSTVDAELVLPIHVEDAAAFYLNEKRRTNDIVRKTGGSRRHGNGSKTDMALLQPGAKMMLRLQLYDLTNKLALYEQGA